MSRFEGVFRSGNVQLLRLLYQERGPIQVNYEHKAPNLTRHALNGVTYEMKGIDRLKDLKSIADFKDLLKAIEEFGIKGISEPGLTAPALFDRIDDGKYLPKLAVERFSGELPYLSGGVLKNPELAIALKHEEGCNPHSQAYRPILCWATDEMAQSFPKSLVPLTPYQEAGSLMSRRSLSEFKAGAGEPENMNVNTFVTGLIAPKSAVNAPMLMDSLCPLAQYHGFNDPQGRVLCETTTDFLLGFDLSGVTPKNTQVSKDFAQGYCPVKLIATQARVACIRDYASLENELWFMDNVCAQDHYGHQGFNELFELLADGHPLQAQAKEMMTPEQWKGILNKADGQKLKATSLIAMHQAFGVDNTGLRITVTSSEIDAYLAANFRFSDDSNFFDSSKQYKHHLDQSGDAGSTAVLTRLSSSTMRDRNEISGPGANLLEMATKDFQDVVLKLNIWPSDSERPKDLADALRMAGPMELDSWGNNRAMGIRAILADAGLEACAQVAKTPRSWLKLTEVFSREEITPYISQMPREAKGKLLEQDLGM